MLRVEATRVVYPDTDLAVLHLGGTTLPGGLMVTMDGRQGAELLAAIAPRRAVPIHYDDYEVFKSPLADFRAEVERRGLAECVTYVERGDTVPL
jgi:L-ascorbate metabolism protein UlaG (beta-lactamase superfamily)